MKATELKKRWNTDPGCAFVKHLEGLGRSGHGYEIRESPFGVVPETGRLDLRGFAFPEATFLTDMRRLTFRFTDFTGGVLKRTHIEGSTFSDVLFDSCSLRNIAEIGNTFEKCTFRSVSLRGAVLGYRGSRFTQCHFDQADFIQAGFIRPEFDDCDFVNCTFSGIDFKAASFERCEFRGEVRGVWFRGGFPSRSLEEQWGIPRPNKMTGVSFQKAKLFELTFSDGCDLSTVVPPDDGRHALFDRWPEHVETVFEQSRAWQEPCRRQGEVFYIAFETHAKNQDWYLIGVDDVMNQFGKECGMKIWEALAKPKE